MARRWKKQRKRDKASDATGECGCCLVDAFAFTLLLGGTFAWRRRRR